MVVFFTLNIGRKLRVSAISFSQWNMYFTSIFWVVWRKIMQASEVLDFWRLYKNMNWAFPMSRSFRSSRQEVFLRKGVLKICSIFTVEHPCRSVISIKLLCNFIEIAIRHGCSLVNLLHIFRTSFSKSTSGWLLLKMEDLDHPL